MITYVPNKLDKIEIKGKRKIRNQIYDKQKYDNLIPTQVSYKELSFKSGPGPYRFSFDINLFM